MIFGLEMCALEAKSSFFCILFMIPVQFCIHTKYKI